MKLISKAWMPIIMLIIMSFSVFAQQKITSTRIKVIDAKGQPIVGAVVYLTSNRAHAITDVDGLAIIDLHGAGEKDSLKVQYLGYDRKSIATNSKVFQKKEIKIILKSSDISLDDVVVQGYSEQSKVERSSFTVSAIDTKELKGLTKDLNESLNEVPGVKVRQQGGMGSNYNFTVNGFSGSQVKFFIDGIPMEFMGSSYGLNSLPINMAERIEVYKGAIPVYLGADVLGAAVNIVTNQKRQDYVDVSYSYGSFNQNQFSALTKTYLSDHVAWFTNVIGNYADNDYKVKVDIYDVNDFSYQGTDEVRRFHDGYKSGSVETGLSFENYSWVDKLTLRAIFSADYKEQQTGMNMTQVAGEAFTKSKMFMTSLLYQKNHVISEDSKLRFFASYNRNLASVVDTSSNKYNWNGDYSTSDIGTSGELLRYKTDLTFHDQSWMGNLSYELPLNDKHKLIFNNTTSYFRRVGTDDVNPYEIPYKEPNILFKNIFGASYVFEPWGDRWSTSIFYKNYHMKLESANAQYSTYEKVENNYQDNGGGVSTTFFFLDDLQLKTSYEKTYRMPEPIEALGDGLLIQNNANLKPEKSDNLNVGLLWKKTKGNHHWMIDVNYFYRYSKDLIRLDVGGVVSSYQNLSAVSGSCYNIDLGYQYKRRWKLHANATYLNDVSKSDEYGFYDVRIPNKPYLYGNIGLTYTFPHLFNEMDSFSITWNTNYVHAFYLAWPNMGLAESKYTIPMQLSSDLSLYYQWSKSISVALACTNIFDAELYDNYALQKPGRAFSIKLRYNITKQK
ncbi:TonB-dependent receptor [Halosquirtibacter laminarini]|uniref:TonB-dependent receptor n=1 Tax=Halosquirtibacter laminarini TaxID=3374600 RepID=A0AC61NGC8_9BACT|nr:TonB-dependent receptor [Prolixibacteraceae bacterium]